MVGSQNPLLLKIARSVVRRDGYVNWVHPALGSIELYRPAWLESEVNIDISDREVAYLTLSTESGDGILGPINEATEDAAVRRLEVEMARVAKEFYRVAVDLEFSESAFELLVLLKKTHELSSI